MTEQTRERAKLKLNVESLPAGRSRIVIEDGGALEHTDQLNLKSERQRLRIAQACDAKCPGCLDEVHALLEKEALRQRVKFDPREDDLCRFVFTSADKVLSE